MIAILPLRFLLVALTANAAEPSLEERVQRLERAVAELQHRGQAEAESLAPAKGIHCELSTPFDGTFRAIEPTESAARAGALARCRAEAKGSLYCEAKAVVCGKR